MNIVVTALTAFAFGLISQAPVGTISGIVRDPSGAAIPNATITATSETTHVSRTASSSDQGSYSFPALLPGNYEIAVEVPAFDKAVRQASVEAGATTTADFVLAVGQLNEAIEVETFTPQIQTETHSVGGLVTRNRIESLPLNSRSFIELAKLEPGVQPPTRGSNNRMFVPALGQPGGNSGRGTRVTLDGGSIMAVGNGGSAMGLSQEAVQEFQISTVNFDLTTGITNGAAINVVTRSGGNDFHGTGVYFFRDHNLAAYPALKRDAANPDPFFQRRQFGFAIGGPIRRDRLFFFGSWERNEQRGVVATTLVSPDFAHLSRITPSPLFGNQLTMRIDGRISTTHTGFLRYSHDGSHAFGPTTLSAGGLFTYPSGWSRQPVWADQTVLGLTSVLSPNVVNDMRFSYFFISSKEIAAAPDDCSGCLGLGAPAIATAPSGNVSANLAANLFVGQSTASNNLGRRFHLNDVLSLQHGNHRTRLGMDWEYNRGGLTQWTSEPASLVLYSPEEVRRYNALPQTPAELRIPLPAAFNTVDDVLQLPLRTVTVGIGDAQVPQENGGKVRTYTTLRAFFHDIWRSSRRITVNYGLGWSIDRNLNYDLRKPTLLAPIVGANALGPTRRNWMNFSPVVGFSFMPTDDAKTVVRAGAGYFYDFLNLAFLNNERVLLGPPGLGRQNFQGTGIFNAIGGIPGVPLDTPLNFPNSPTRFTGANMLSILPASRAKLLQGLSNANQSVQAIQVTKQGNAVNPEQIPAPSALHVNIGVQRELAPNLVVSADFAYRHFIHVGQAIDRNHFNSARGPLIPRCTAAQRDDPQALCSNGPINVLTAAGRAAYKGLLVRVDKRFSHRLQFLGSWAYSSNTGTNTGNGFDVENWLQSRGPLTTDLTHIVNAAVVIQMPRQFEFAANFSYSTAPPFNPFVGGIDFNGDGTTGDLLPGTTPNAFNRGLNRGDLQRLVDEFNVRYANTRDAKGAIIPRLALPSTYSLDDNFHSLDLRLSRTFLTGEHAQLSLIGEVFNVFNVANLTGYSGDLTNSAFGQPTSRATQVFGSAGTRALQIAARFRF